MPLRLMFNGDRIIGGVSAYSKIMYETCTRLAKENYKIAHIPMGRANKMGIQNFQNILVYPSGNHPFNEDIAIEHYLNFKADLLITVKEPWCVPPETLVETIIGSIPIKDFIDKNYWKWLKVKSSHGFVKVLDTQKHFYTNALIEIRTCSGNKVMVTKDNLIYVVGRGWVLPNNINIGDGIIAESEGNQFEEVDKGRSGCTSQILLPENTFEGGSKESWASNQICCSQSFRTRGEKGFLLLREKLDDGRRCTDEENVSNVTHGRDIGSFTKASMAYNTSTDTQIRNKTIGNGIHANKICDNCGGNRENGRNRQSVSSCDNRRRRVHRNIQVSLSENRQRILRSILFNNKHLPRANGLVRKHLSKETVNSPPFDSKNKQFRENSMLQAYGWNKEITPSNQSNFAIYDYQEKESRVIHQICGSKTIKTSQIPLWRKRIGNLQGNQGIEEKVIRIQEIPYNGLVYDLTTESGNFFANGILIHNCFNSLYQWAINFVPFCPIDHSPVSPIMTSKLHTAFKVIAVSRFGQRELKEAGIESVYIPHGVDCEVYRPLPEHKSECKKMFGLPPDDFTVGVIAMNRARKMISRMLRGYARFKELNPDIKTHMMLWTDIRPANEYEESPMGVADVSVDLLPEIMALGLGEAVVWPDRKLVREGLPEWLGEDYRTGWDMVKLYGSFDVLLNCTGGEGFGMPHIEALACGVVPVTTDYAAGPETVGVGLTVEPVDYVIMNTPGTRFALASIDGMAEALTKIYNADREKLAKKARAFAERYDWKIIIDAYWKPFLEQCETELYPKITKKGVSSWA